MVVADPNVRNEIATEARTSLLLLYSCIGIKLTLDDIIPGQPVPFEVDWGLVAALLQTSKGKKLIGRSFRLLENEHRWTLLPVMLARLLQKEASDQTAEDLITEGRLLITLLQVYLQLSYSYVFSLFRQSTIYCLIHIQFGIMKKWLNNLHYQFQMLCSY